MSEVSECACCGPADESDGATAETDGSELTCYCPIDDVIEVVGRKYAMRIVALLGANGPTRFGELEERLEATSTSTLSDSLDELVGADLVERRSFDEVPPRVEYSLTPAGRELEERLQPLLEWASA